MSEEINRGTQDVENVKKIVYIQKDEGGGGTGIHISF
jgi:hypothetical protein